jgi:hypothetical protein
MYRRYALYVTPEGPLATRGAAWLGWDIAAGRAVPQPQVGGLDMAEITRRPRKYGLHATIKPPMVLAVGTTSEELEQAAGALARSATAVTLDGLEITRMGSFLALTPRGDTAPLRALAARVVEELDPFRAPASAQELARRRTQTLTPSQQQNLIRWGTPHIMQNFRFHITLTGPLKEIEATTSLVEAYFKPVLPMPFSITHLTLAGADANGMFHTITRLPLGI